MRYEALEKRDWDAKRGAMARSAPHNLANVCWYIRWPLDVCESDRNEKDRTKYNRGVAYGHLQYFEALPLDVFAHTE